MCHRDNMILWGEWFKMVIHLFCTGVCTQDRLWQGLLVCAPQHVSWRGHGGGLAIHFQVAHSCSWQVGLGHQLGVSVLFHVGLFGGCLGFLVTW